MKTIFDTVSQFCSKKVTTSYSTSFTLAIKMLEKSMQQDIYNIYGFVRLADEIVDSFHKYPKKQLLLEFEEDTYKALKEKISLNPILNAFQKTAIKFKIDKKLIDPFFNSMKMDLNKKVYTTKEEYDLYIYGSANVVGLMCLKVFLKGDEKKYKALEKSALALGSAFQKTNFLRDLKADYESLQRTYFPNLNYQTFNSNDKQLLIDDINKDFNIALKGIKQLPMGCRFGVYTAYKYYVKLLKKINNKPINSIKNKRIRIPNYKKIDIIARSYVRFKFNTL